MWSSIWKQRRKKCVRAGAVLLACLLLAGCGGDDEKASPNTSGGGTLGWNGPPDPAKNGTIPILDFNYWAEQLPESKKNLRSLAIEFVRPHGPRTVTVDTPRAGSSTVTVLLDDLEDDSVSAMRYTLEFSVVTGDRPVLNSARVDYKCQPMRGHQDFSPELCL